MLQTQHKNTTGLIAAAYNLRRRRPSVARTFAVYGIYQRAFGA